MKRFVVCFGSIISLTGLVGCAAPPAESVDFSGPRPPIVEEGLITQSVEFEANAPIECVLPTLLHTPLKNIFEPTPLIPAVAETEVLTPTWGDVGSRKRVVLSDGHQAVEELLAIDGARSFRYQVWGFTTPVRFLADYAIGEFKAFPTPTFGTRVVWTYRFKSNSWVARAPLSLFVHLAWEDFMDGAAENMARIASDDPCAQS